MSGWGAVSTDMRRGHTFVVPDLAEDVAVVAVAVVVVVVGSELPDDIGETVLGSVEELLEVGLPFKVANSIIVGVCQKMHRVGVCLANMGFEVVREHPTIALDFAT